MNNLIVYFSKNRAMQLDLTLYSHRACMDGWANQDKFVLYNTSSFYFEQGYEILRKRYPTVKFIKENDFKKDLLMIVRYKDYNLITFVVDDTVFCGGYFFFKDIEKILNSDPLALGFSLRLGLNTKNCYSLDIENDYPYIENVRDTLIGRRILKYRWGNNPKGKGDFYYPLEVSSSVYRTEDLIPFLGTLDYNNPKYLEYYMSINHHHVSKLPYLYCYEQSVAFSNPLNVTFENNTNRVGNKGKYDITLLNKRYLDGQVIDFEPFRFFSSNGCHQEVDLTFIGKDMRNART
jgi:hypothetical protein